MGRELKNLRAALLEMPESFRPVCLVPEPDLPPFSKLAGRSMELSGKPARGPLKRELRTLKRTSQELSRSMQLSKNNSPLGSLKVAYGSSPVIRRSSRISCADVEVRASIYTKNRELKCSRVDLQSLPPLKLRVRYALSRELACHM